MTGRSIVGYIQPCSVPGCEKQDLHSFNYDPCVLESTANGDFRTCMMRALEKRCEIA